MTNFANAMSKVAGLEFLGAQALEQLEPDEDFRAVDGKGKEKSYGRQMFLLASDAVAWRELIGLWDRYKRGLAPARGYTPFRDLFDQLRDVREWDDRDRLRRAGAGDTWLREFQELGDELVPFEAELWLRRDEARRRAAVDALSSDLVAVGGRIQGQFVREEIDYHGVLGVAPAWRLLDAAASGEIEWLSTSGVRLFRAIGQMAAPPPPDDVEEDEGEATSQQALGAAPTGGPRIALLDGLPLENHQALAGRLRLDDPEGWGAEIPVRRRRHGTMMASLIIQGDLSLAVNADALSEPIYVRPVLRPDAPDWVQVAHEMVPVDRLPVDVVYEAVARLFEGPDPVAPSIKAVVLAVGDPAQQFDRFVSPLARLIDWMSADRDILFVISAGNHLGKLVIPHDEVDLGNPLEIEHEVLDALRREALSRRLLSPGEAINSLTIGAAHDDESGSLAPAGTVDPLTDSNLGSPISPIASGVNRSVNPDVLMPGGRQMVRVIPRDPPPGFDLVLAHSVRPPGLRAAAPGLAAELDRYVHETGTSGATALAGHAAGKALERLAELRERGGAAFPDSSLDAVLAKAVIAHSAEWGTAAGTVREVLRDAGESSGRAAVARFLGNGRSRPELSLQADDHRVVLMQAGRIRVDAAHRYDLPLPRSLAGVAVERRLTLTLAWLSPIRPRNSAYREVALDLNYRAGRDELFGDRREVDNRAAGRGTLQHEVLVSGRAVPFVDGDTATFEVSCRAAIKGVDETVPYALLITIDTPVELQLPIYNEVSTQLQARAQPLVPVRP